MQCIDNIDFLAYLTRNIAFQGVPCIGHNTPTVGLYYVQMRK